jgi:hypothetical protein
MIAVCQANGIRPRLGGGYDPPLMQRHVEMAG